MNISEKFIQLRKNREGALIGFITVGDPSPEDTPKIANSLIKGGVDILELGLPFSDPVADGTTIQKASQRALEKGMNPDLYFEIAQEIKGIPKVCLTYYNLVLQRGLKKFVQDCQNSGISGLIVPDLPPEEADSLLNFCQDYDINLIFLAAPVTPKKRLKKILEKSTGFLYVVSLLGTTGVRERLANIAPTIERIKELSPQLPLAVGFGISKPEHVKKVINFGAQGVIVGSAFVKIIEKYKKEKLGKLKKFAQELKEATKQKGVIF